MSAGTSRGVKRGADGKSKTAPASVPAPAPAPIASSSRGGRNSARRGDVRRLPAILPNDVNLRFPRRLEDPARGVSYVLSLLGLSPSSVSSSRTVGTDGRVVCARFRSHEAAATVVNSLRAGELAPGLRIDAHWSDPNSEDLVAALLNGGEGSDGS